MPPPDETLYLIDGHAQIFRAYYAIRGGMNSPVTGEPTHAVFGFAGMLLKLFKQFRPRYVALALDAKGKTFRHEIYPDYKANRAEMPEDLPSQIERIVEMSRMFGIPVLRQEGVEADDIIATLATRMTEDPSRGEVQVRLVSKDKDLEQLLSDRVTMFDIHTDTTIDIATLKAEKGITPAQAVELQTLTGDTVDNVRGVEGIGPKTAAKLIEQYGTVDNLLAHLDEIKGKRRENLEKARDTLPLTRQLVTLKRDVAIDFDLEDARLGGIDAAGLRRLFKELGFRRHQADLDALLADASAAAPRVNNDDDPKLHFAAGLFDAGPTPLSDASPSGTITTATTAADYDYSAITTRAQLDELVQTLRAHKLIALDTETIGLGHRAPLCGLCFAWKPGSGVYVPVASCWPESHLDLATVLDALRPILEDPAVGKTGHNLKYDMLVLRNAGVRVRGVAFDSMIAAHLLGLPGKGLDDVALAVLNHEMIPITRLIGARARGVTQKTMDQVPLEEITPYAAEDADISLRLYHEFHPKLRVMGMEELCDQVETPLVAVLADMESTGIRVDPDVLLEQKTALAARIVELRDAIHEAAGEPFNIDSPKQLAEILFTRLKLPMLKRTRTGPSTDIEVLEALADREDLTSEQAKVPRLMIEYRQLTKLVGTYLDSLREAIHPPTGRVHASFHQTGAATGRLSSSDPNLQNIPVRTEIGRRIRKAFIAEPDQLLIGADYSQIELRVLAHLSRDEALCDAFDRDMDIHTAVAARVFGIKPEEVSREQRDHAKTINFGIIYGITPYGLARRVEGMSVEDARAMIAEYKRGYPGIDAFMRKCVEHADAHGYVTTILGRRRAITQIKSSNAQTRALGERLAINSVVQGSAADLIKKAMVSLHRTIDAQHLPLRILLQIHDELILETPEKEAESMAAIVKREMEQAMTLRVPLKVEVGMGRNWLEAK